MLTVRDLVVEVGAKRIVDGATFQVRPGEKVGLVGRNGAGKTTLLRVLGGATSPKSGTVRRPPATGYLSQDPRADAVPDDTTVMAHVLSGRGLDALAARLEKLRVALEESSNPENIAKFAAAQSRFEDAGGYAAESEVRRLAGGVGLRDDRLDLTLGSLSGGERRRAELVRILFGGSDLLLLDEPTNHLDADARTWLLKFLRGYRGALVVVSHDLDLLDEAITRVVQIDRETEEATGTIVEYKGTYSQYLVARDQHEERQAKLAASQTREIARLSTLASGMRGQTAKRARVAKNLDGRIERINAARIVGPSRRKALALRFPEPPMSGRTVLTATELWKSFGALDVFADVSFDVGRGERLLVMGLNGAGKTTLLRILADQLASDLGDVTLGRNVSMGYYAQEHEGIFSGRSLLDHMRGSSPLGDGGLRNLLGMFGLSGEKVFQDAATLSGGEKTKLALAQLVAGKHNVLLLDEPTNNLDPMSRTATGEALAAWPGTMVVVSHDTEFVRSLAPDRVLLMPDGTLDYFDDDLLDLLELV
ncbi:MAG: ABC-F family ATP-binding cassette domain-containing protein [Acidimicrobiia bacterium]